MTVYNVNYQINQLVINVWNVTLKVANSAKKVIHIDAVSVRKVSSTSMEPALKKIVPKVTTKTASTVKYA